MLQALLLCPVYTTRGGTWEQSPDDGDTYTGHVAAWSELFAGRILSALVCQYDVLPSVKYSVASADVHPI